MGEDDFCRLCAERKPIDDLVGIDDDNWSKQELDVKIAQILQIQILPTDTLPTFVCSKCCGTVIATWEFHGRAQQAQETLRLALSRAEYDSDTLDGNIVSVKDEPFEVKVEEVDLGCDCVEDPLSCGSWTYEDEYKTESDGCCGAPDYQPGDDASVPLRLGKIKSNGEQRRGKKCGNFCLYCKEQVLNFARHLQRKHGDEADVRAIRSLPAGHKDKKRLLADLRNKGARSIGGFPTAEDRRRQKRLVENNRKLVGHLSADERLKAEVFPRMRYDRISVLAKADPLICEFAAQYIKGHRKKHYITVASRKMRELAKLLVEMKKDVPVTNLLEALAPKYFGALVAATKTLARYNADKDLYRVPSLAMNMGPTLKQCCVIGIVGVRSRKLACASSVADLHSTVRLFETTWRTEIYTKALYDLNANKIRTARIDGPQDCPAPRKWPSPTKVPWTTKQKEVVTDFFAAHIRESRPPRKHECLEVKFQNGDLFCNKDWLKIKVYVQNVYTSKYRT